MTLIRWEPFKEADDFFRNISPALFGRWPRAFGENGETQYEWSPAADISETEKAHRIERFYGTFRRSFGLPEHVDPKGIRAESKDGILLVHVPKDKAEKSKSVQIKVE